MDESARLTPAAERARYESHRNDPADPQYMAYLSRVALPLVERLPAGARGLDYGCGPTEGMKALLSPRAFSVESYDPFFFPNEELLKNHYDFVLCSEALEHFFDPARELGRIAELVREGGWLGVSSALAPAEPAAFAAWWYRRDPTHVVFFQEETVHWMARHWGWELVKLESPVWVLRRQ